MIPKHFHGHEEFRRRLRRLKWMLRPLPRRATIHRYPVLKYFAKTARERSYLWSFRRNQVIRAIYIGSILSLLPIYGLQVIFAFILSLVTRANFMIMCALQFITNPITAVPLYILGFKIGDFLLHPFFEPKSSFSIDDIKQQTDASLIDILKQLFESMGEAGAGEMAAAVKYMFLCMSFGGVVLGYFLGFILSFLYQWSAHRAQEYKRKNLQKS